METTIKLSLLAASAGGTTYAYIHWRDVSATFKVLVQVVLLLTAIAAIPEAITGAEKALVIAKVVLQFALARPTAALFAVVAIASTFQGWHVWSHQIMRPSCKCRICRRSAHDAFGFCMTATLAFATAALTHSL